MINPKYKNVFMAPASVGEDPELEQLVVNGHTINSKLGAIILDGPGRTIAETLRSRYRTDGQTIGSAFPRPKTETSTHVMVRGGAS